MGLGGLFKNDTALDKTPTQKIQDKVKILQTVLDNMRKQINIPLIHKCIRQTQG